MYRFYLNGTEVTEPQGFEAMILRKSASERYGGFIGGSFGFVELNGGLVFGDPESVEIIDAERKDIKGRVDVLITFCKKTVFEGIIDLASTTKKNCSYTAQIVSDTNQAAFLSKHETVYAIQPNRKITLPKKEYFAGGAYEIGTNREFKSSVSGGIKLNIAVPLNVIRNNGEVPIAGMKDSQMSMLGDDLYMFLSVNRSMHLINHDYFNNTDYVFSIDNNGVLVVDDNTEAGTADFDLNSNMEVEVDL